MDYPANYTKRPLWQWLIIYLIIGGLLYIVAYYLFIMKARPVAQTTMQNSGQTTVTITASSFSPSNLTINHGATIIWTNQSGVAATVNSNPHPTHTDYPPLNIGLIENGATASLTFPDPGTYSYHNHLQPDQTGIIVVR